MVDRRHAPDGVKLVREEPSALYVRAYRVVRHGQDIGRVVLRQTYWERRTPGCRYVDARGTYARWFAQPLDQRESGKFRVRRAAVDWLCARHERG